MFKIIKKSRYRAILKAYEAIYYDNKRLRKEIKDLKKPYDIITVEAKEHIDKLCPIALLEEGRVKRNLAIKLMRQIYRQIYKDESIIRYHMLSDKPDMIFAQIRCVKFNKN